MVLNLNAYTASVLAASFLSFILMVKGLTQRKTASIDWFTALMSQMVVWSTAYFFELAGDTFQWVLFWSKVQYLGAPFIAPTWLSLVLTYTGKLGRKKPSKYNLLFIIPALSLVMAWTNGYHHLLWQQPYLFRQDLFSTLNFVPGIWYMVNIIYAYTLFILSTVILFLSYFKTSPVFRWQIILLLTFSITNWLGNLAYILKVLPEHFDLTPVIFAVSSIPLTLVIFKNSFFSIAPVAREVLMDTIDEPILVLDRVKRVLDFNLEAQKFSQFPPEKIRGKYAPDIFPAIITQAVLDKLAAIQPEGFEQILSCNAFGKPLVYRIKISPLYGGHGHRFIVGYIIVMNDITQISGYAQELEQKNTELDAFSHMVAHDIKNPLNAILGFSTLLTENYASITDNERKRMIGSIHQSGIKLDTIVNELFLLSRIGLSEKLNFVPVNMKIIIDTVLEHLSILIEENNAVIHTPDQWTPINSYSPWIEQVWINYISNAVKYGGIPPVIELREEIGKKTVKYLVIDNGDGITEEKWKQLFIPFTRLEEERAEGTGLGLSIVKRIIEKLGGSVGVQSGKTKGSVFYFTLPLKNT